MDLNDSMADNVVEKPKKTRKKRAKVVAAEEQTLAETVDTSIEEPLPETAKPKKSRSKKTKSGSSKRKTSTSRKTKKKPDLEIDINIQDTTPEATGQAGVKDVKIETVVKAPEVIGLSDFKPQVSVLQAKAEVSSPVVNNSGILNTSVTATENVILPLAAVKVRNVVAKVVDLVTEIIPNKVIVQGTVHEQLFFVGTDGIVHHLADDIPFSTFLDIPGIVPGMNAQVSAVIEEVITELATDGLSILKKIIIEVFVKITETVQVNLSPGSGPLLFLQQVVGENSTQKLIETDLSLFTPALKIDEITGVIQDITVEIINNKVIIQGILHKQIFFVDTANLGRHQAEDIPFSLFVDILGAAPGMDVQVHPRIEAIFFKLIDPTTVRQKAILEFFVKVTEATEQQVAVGTGPLFKVEEFIGENRVQDLNESVITLAVPAIKVREIVAKLINFTTHIIPDKVIVQGLIHKQIFFIGTDNIEHHQAEEVPFSVFLDIPGAEPGDNVHLNPQIEAIFFELLSSTQLRQKVIIAIQATITREIQLNLELGTGSLFKMEQVVGENTKQLLIIKREEIPIPPVGPITITTETIIFPPVAVVGQQQIILRNTVELPVKAVKIKEIQAVIADVSFNVITDGVVIEGVVNKTVIFVDADNIVRTVTEQVPFSILVSVPGITPSQVTNVTVTLEDISFSLNPCGTEVTQNIVLLGTVEGTTAPATSVTVVTDVTGPGITQTKVLVEALVLTPDGPVLRQFEVVTDVSGGGITGVTRQTLVLQVVGEPAPRPISVVTGVQFT